MPQPSGFNFRILVVDDEPSILETSAAVLGTRGYEVRTAADGFQALAGTPPLITRFGDFGPAHAKYERV